MKTWSIIFLSLILLISCNMTTKKAKEQQNEESLKSVQIQTTISGDTSINFTNNVLGKYPKTWSANFTGNGEMGAWKVLNDQGNRVLAQTSKENRGYHFDVLIENDLTYKDLEISVKIKGMQGEEDQGGGPVWRYQDENNYYVARANPLENNYRVYKVVNGKRKQLESAHLEINSQEWYTLKISMKGNRIRCYFNGELQLETTDNTIQNAGKTGLWTKADAQTYFDDYEVKNRAK